MKTIKTQLYQGWKNGDALNVQKILKRTSKLYAMDFAVLIALTEGAEAASRLLRLMAGYGIETQPTLTTEHERKTQ